MPRLHYRGIYDLKEHIDCRRKVPSIYQGHQGICCHPLIINAPDHLELLANHMNMKLFHFLTSCLEILSTTDS